MSEAILGVRANVEVLFLVIEVESDHSHQTGNTVNTNRRYEQQPADD